MSIRPGGGATSTTGASATFADKGIWAASTAYAVGDMVEWQARRWICAVAHTSSTDFDTSKFTASGRHDQGPLFYQNLFVVGDSWSGIWPLRLQQMLQPPQYYNGGVGGTQVLDAAHQLAKVTNAYTTGLHVLASLVNDAANGQTTLRTNQVTNGLRGWIDLAAATTAGRQTTSGGLAASFFTFSGTWTTTADTNQASGQRKTTTTQNDYVECYWPGDKVTLLLLGQPDSSGASYSITDVAGNVLSTGSLSSQTITANQMVPIRLSGWGAGWHTVRVTKTDATGTTLGIDCTIYPSTTPPAMLVTKIPPLADATHNTNRTWVNSVADSVAAETFTTGLPLVVADLSTGTSWSTTQDTNSNSNGYHPTDRGSDKLSKAALTLLRNSLSYTQGVVSSAYVAPTTVTPQAVADNFTRPNGPPGTTSTGAQSWQTYTPSVTAPPNFQISSNKLLATTQPSAYSTCVVDNGKSDTTVTWTVAGNTNLGLVFRFVDSKNFYFWGLGGNVWKVVNGTASQLTPATGAATAFNANDVCSVVLSGTSITVKVNGATVITYTDSTFSGTKHGICGTLGAPTGGVSAFSAS